MAKKRDAKANAALAIVVGLSTLIGVAAVQLSRGLLDRISSAFAVAIPWLPESAILWLIILLSIFLIFVVKRYFEKKQVRLFSQAKRILLRR